MIIKLTNCLKCGIIQLNELMYLIRNELENTVIGELYYEI